MKNSRKKLLPVFLTFLKIGAFTFGGGYAMIPLIQRESVEKHKWVTDEDILEIIAIAESTPGPIAINGATFVGYKACGLAGACLATLGVVLPSFVIITLIALLLRQFQDLRAVQYAFWGIRAGVLALIAKACYNMARQNPKNPLSYIVALGAFVLVGICKVNVLLVILLCALTGLFVTLWQTRRVKK